jgi:hypothetical protein
MGKAVQVEQAVPQALQVIQVPKAGLVMPAILVITVLEAQVEQVALQVL